MSETSQADLARYEQAQRQYAALRQHVERLDQVLSDLRRARATLAGLKDAQGPQDVLVPVGAGVHIHARVDPARPVIRPLGADYATEGDMASALAVLEERVKETQAALTKADKDMQQVGAMVEKMASDMQDAGMV